MLARQKRIPELGTAREGFTHHNVDVKLGHHPTNANDKDRNETKKVSAAIRKQVPWLADFPFR
jgi:hypothetical protein